MECIPILESAFAMHNPVRRLPTLEARRHFAMLLLALVAATGGLAVAARGPAADADAFVIGAFGVGEGVEDGGGAVLGEGWEGVEEGGERLICGSGSSGRGPAEEREAGRHRVCLVGLCCKVAIRH